MTRNKMQTNNTLQTQENETEKFVNSKVEGTIEDALSTTGIGRFNVWIIITSGLVLYAVTSEVWAIGYVIPMAGCDLELSLKQKTILVTAGSLGMMTTQYFWGYLSDNVGRRNVMLYTLAAGFMCTIISAFVPTFWLVALFRFLNGTCTACSGGLIYVYIGEFFAVRHRTVAISVTSIFYGLNCATIPILAWWIIPNQFNLNLASWRIFLLAIGSPTIPAWIFLYFSPESPKFLVQAKRNKEALQLIHRISQINRTKDTKIIQKLIVEETNQTIRIWELFNRQFIWKTLLVCLLQAGVFAISGGFLLWYPNIQKKIFNSTQHVTACEAFNLPMYTNFTDLRGNDYLANTSLTDCSMFIDSSIYYQNMLIGVCYLIGNISMSTLIKFAGIKTILVSFQGIAGIATISLYYINAPRIIDAIFLILLVMSGLCVAVVSAAVAAIFPTYLSGKAMCLTMLSGRLGVILSSSLLGYLMRWNCDITFMLLAACLISCSLISVLLPVTHSSQPKNKR